jgi:hypothetical protein
MTTPLQELDHSGKIGRMILINDTAFRTWVFGYADILQLMVHFRWRSLLFYLYAGEVNFDGLGPRFWPFGLSDVQTCSPKSMYRLADKVYIIFLQKSNFELTKFYRLTCRTCKSLP